MTRLFQFVSGIGCLVLAGGLAAQLVRQANSTLTLPANAPTSAFVLQDAFALTFSGPIALATPPGETNRLFVVERPGRIQIVSNLTATPAKSLFFDISGRVTQSGECGLLGLAFHPQFATNGFFYVTYSTFVGSTLFERLSRFTAAGNTVDVTTEVILINQVDEADNHNGGDIHFGPDGYLYYSIGDEGGGNDQFNNSQRIDKDFFSGILRIDVDRKPGSLEPNIHPSVVINGVTHTANYAIPPDNPFVGATSFNGFAVTPSAVRTEWWAVGLRNPFRFSFDSVTGVLYLGDVGQGAREEIDIIVKGGNYGWNYREGDIAGPGTPPANIVWNPVSPIWTYDRSQGFVTTGGVVSRGSRLSQLYGTYIYCDEGSGRIWSLKKNDVTGVYSNTQIVATTESNLAAFGIDPSNGDVLACNIGNGHIRRLVASTVTGSFPATLSATGAFSNVAALTPNPGIVAYEPNVPFWSDYALKTRWFSIPSLTPKFTFAATGNWTLPTGTVWIKNFDIEGTRGNPATARHLETRFIVKTTDSVYGISYKWRADQTDADLVAENGDTSTFPVTVGGSTVSQTWTFPSRASCLNCHTYVGGYALSFNTPQLNHTNTYGGVPQNQIAALSSAGYFSAPVSGINTFARYAAGTDTSQSLEWRARSYLSVNCAQCHQPGGPALGNWDARYTTKTANAGIVNGPLNDNLGDANNRVVVPNDLSHSVLYQRINAVPGPGTIHMPPIASNERDLTSIQLIADWIQLALPTYQTFAQWQLLKFGSTSAPNAQPAANPDGDFNNNRTEYLVGTDPNSPLEAWTYSVGASGGNVTLTFPRIANRRFQAMVSTDLQTWSLWDVPANAPTYSATSIMDSMTGPAAAGPQFFRFEIDLP
jgi:glucose/arabinose dehydrogenase/mono/diheme cytochrome c family protein